MTVTDIANLRTLNGSSGPNITLLGYYSPGDLGGGEFYWDGTSASGENGGTIIVNNANTGRWIRVLNSGKINVRWFGATGDGSTDDTSRIQAAIDYCGPAGYALYIPEGTYIVSSGGAQCLWISYNNFCLEGDGSISELKSMNGNQQSMILLIQSSSPSTTQIKNVTVRNIRLNGNKANQSGTYHNHCLVANVSNVINDPANITLDGLYCHSAYSSDPYGDEGGGIALTGWDKAAPIMPWPPQNILVSKCFCWDNDGWGIGTNLSSSFIISNNICWDNLSMGITVWNSRDGLIESNVCYNNSVFGINCEISDKINISSNNVNSTGAACVNVMNSVEILIASNILDHASGYYDFCTLQLNSIYNPFLIRPCSSIKITGNTMSSNGSEGNVLMIRFDPGYDYCYDVDIDNNRIINNVMWKCVDVYCNNLMVSNNDIRGYIRFESNSGYLIIQNNKVSFDDLTSIGFNAAVNTCENLIFKNNLLRCVSNGDSAIFIGSTVTGKVQISGNTCDGSYNQFVRLNSSSVIPLFNNNVILNPSVSYLNTIPTYPPSSGNWGVDTYLENPNPTVSSNKMTIGWKKLPTGSWVKDVSSTV